MSRKKKLTPYEKQRNGLLATVHIAIKDLGILEDDYRDLLRKEFGVKSARAMSVEELERLVGIFKEWGFVPKRKPRPKGGPDQLKKLRARIKEEAEKLDNWETRLPGLTRKFCGTDDVKWSHDFKKLRRFLAALPNIKRADETKSANKPATLQAGKSRGDNGSHP